MHNIHQRVYDENVNKKAVQAEWDNHVRRECWQEGASGLDQPIRWIDHVCENQEEAEKYITSHDKGWYDQLAVKFRSYPTLAPTKALEELKRRLASEQNKKYNYAVAHSIVTFKAEFVGCPNCGSKLKRTLLKDNSCPLCRTDLRSKTTIETLERYEHNIQHLRKQIKAEERKIEERNRKKAVIKWLVKIEYHT